MIRVVGYAQTVALDDATGRELIKRGLIVSCPLCIPGTAHPVSKEAARQVGRLAPEPKAPA